MTQQSNNLGDGMSTTEEQMKALGGEWNSAYGYWELRLSDDHTKTYLYPSQALELANRVDAILSQHTQRAKIIEISTRDTCDYCKEPMKYAGSNDGVKVVRSCAKHLELAKNHLAQLSTKDSTNKEDA